MQLSIIIPVLNEREQLPRTLAALQASFALHEVIVVDGGSTDGTREWLGRQQACLVITTTRGRGHQLKVGASAATGDVLLFLHSDCLLPARTLALLTSALQDERTVGGAFLIRFAEARPRSLHLIAKGINARTRVTRTATGDQGIFVRRTAYEAVGGFADWPLFEDVCLVANLKRLGKFAILPAPIMISGRRYIANGPWRTTFLMYALRLGYWLGIHPKRLYRWFADVRPHQQQSGKV